MLLWRARRILNQYSYCGGGGNNGLEPFLDGRLISESGQPSLLSLISEGFFTRENALASLNLPIRFICVVARGELLVTISMGQKKAH